VRQRWGQAGAKNAHQLGSQPAFPTGALRKLMKSQVEITALQKANVGKICIAL
jgi:hypothetical protein